VNGYNRRAISLYERLGFRPAGRIRGAILLNGTRYDQVIMDLLRSELALQHVGRFRALEQAPDKPA
jgi:RimJ/RimL family protein N-acetyltransferase